MEDDWVVSIKKQAHSSQYVPASLSFAPIFRVPFPLRSVNRSAFTPQMVSIGPYHSNLRDPQFQEMEEYKLLAAKAIAQDMKDGKFGHLLDYIEEHDKEIRSFYDGGLESEGLTAEKLADMIAVDAAFVVAVLHSFYEEHAELFQGKPLGPGDLPHLESRFHPVYVYHFSRPVRMAILQDLLLLENQIPLFVVKEIIKMDERCKSDEEAGRRLEAYVAAMAHRVLPFTKSRKKVVKYVRDLSKDGKHLLDCLYSIVTYSKDRREHPDLRDEDVDIHPAEVPGATKLHNAGVELKGHKKSLMKLSFKDATLCIPRIHVGDHTERILRNLVAYESQMEGRVDVLSYLHFMDYLIDTPKDVDMLVENKIMTETIGSNEHVAKMWNGLCTNTVCVFSKRYSDVGGAAKEHCDSKFRGMWAEFRRRYFSRPWLVVSLCSGAALVVMTLVTLWYTILIYRKELHKEE